MAAIFSSNLAFAQEVSMDSWAADPVRMEVLPRLSGDEVATSTPDGRYVEMLLAPRAYGPRTAGGGGGVTPLGEPTPDGRYNGEATMYINGSNNVCAPTTVPLKYYSSWTLTSGSIPQPTFRVLYQVFRYSGSTYYSMSLYASPSFSLPSVGSTYNDLGSTYSASVSGDYKVEANLQYWTGSTWMGVTYVQSSMVYNVVINPNNSGLSFKVNGLTGTTSAPYPEIWRCPNTPGNLNLAVTAGSSTTGSITIQKGVMTGTGFVGSTGSSNLYSNSTYLTNNDNLTTLAPALNLSSYLGYLKVTITRQGGCD